MAMLILTGPPGVGKSTVAAFIAQRLPRCAVIDADVVRWMVLNPHKASWDGEEGKAQQLLCVRNVCALADNFGREGFDVVILDVLTNETGQLYRSLLQAYAPKIALLLPALDEIKRRNIARGARLTEQEVELVYSWQERLTVCDNKYDNTNLSAKDLAIKLLGIIGGGSS